MTAMLSRSVACGTWAGTELRLHYSAVLVVVLAAVSLHSYLAAIYPRWGFATLWATAVGAALTVLLGSALNGAAQGAVAAAAGARTARLTLCMFGGLVTTRGGERNPRTECWLGTVSPLVNALAGVLCLAVASLGHASPARIPSTPFQAGLVWAGYFNLLLAGVNVLPAYPLGAGRLLRALAWWALRDGGRSLRFALRVTQVAALGGLCVGVIWLVGPRALIGLWSAVTAGVLFETASGLLRDPAVAQGLSSRGIPE